MNDETIRQELFEWLCVENISIKKISAHFGIKYIQAIEEMEHVIKTAKNKNKKIKIIPSECEKCHFVFKDRTRLTKPSRCPKCKSESILEPLFKLI